MVKKTTKSRNKKNSKINPKLTFTDIVFLGIVLVNFISLYIHNLILPWIYLILIVAYIPIDIKIYRSFKAWPWLVVAYSPILVSLYYLDFALSCATFLVVGIANYYVFKERK